MRKKNRNWLAIILLAFFLLPFLSFIYLKHGEKQKIVNYVSVEQLLTDNHLEVQSQQFQKRPFIVHFDDHPKTKTLLSDVFNHVVKDTLYNVLSISKSKENTKPNQKNWVWMQVNEAAYDSLARYVFHLVYKEIDEKAEDVLLTNQVVMVNHRHFIKEHLPLTSEEEKDQLVFNLKKMILKRESSKIFK